MIIERFFGKGRSDQPEAQAKPRGKNDAQPRRAPDQGQGTTTGTGAVGREPRIEATDAPASLARSGQAATTGPSAKVPVASAVEAAAAVVAEPTHEEIAARAYDLWLQRGRPEGGEQENWIEAERQLRAERP